MRLSTVLVANLVIATTPRLLEAQARIDTNVVYGMYSGTALLMDVHHPAAPNGYGILLIPGNGWHEPLSFDAEPFGNVDSVRIRTASYDSIYRSIVTSVLSLP